MTAEETLVVADVIAQAVLAATEPLAARLAQLEARAPANGKDGAPGLDGKDGRDGIDGRDGLPGVPGAPGPKGLDGRDGKDGAPGLHGKDGAKGLDGRDGKDAAPGLHGKDGVPGRDGVDGLGFDDLDLVMDAEKGLLLQFTRGVEVKTFSLPCPMDFGIWTAGRVYPKGAGVTHDGAWWIAQTTTSAQPGLAAAASREWRLAVRRGKDGRPGKDGKDGGGE
jgi:hypothetical protein